jgi:hypothetical protein
MLFQGQDQTRLHGTDGISKYAESRAKTLSKRHAFQVPQVHNVNMLGRIGTMEVLMEKLLFDKF